ncbi:hypothetical protein HY642_01620 [Candidatus Woesearchaeota archaeon]|nr:hypothetical protein [Candidatus Woesearchaeota archaeon]
MEKPPLPSEETVQSWIKEKKVSEFNTAFAELLSWYKYHVRYEGTPVQKHIEDALKSPVFGQPVKHDLDCIARSLDRMPAVDACLVYVFPPIVRMRLLGSSQYLHPNGIHGECIILGNPVKSKVVTHEFSHKRTHELGTAFLNDWSMVNKYEYGKGVREHRDLQDLVWEDDLSSRPKRGFCGPYCRTNAHEDIATWTSYARHGRKDLIWYAARGFDAEHTAISTAKLGLLVEGKFIHQREADRVVDILRRNTNGK